MGRKACKGTLDYKQHLEEFYIWFNLCDLGIVRIHFWIIECKKKNHLQITKSKNNEKCVFKTYLTSLNDTCEEIVAYLVILLLTRHKPKQSRQHQHHPFLSSTGGRGRTERWRKSFFCQLRLHDLRHLIYLNLEIRCSTSSLWHSCTNKFKQTGTTYRQ